jgi:hypothetical protein
VLDTSAGNVESDEGVRGIRNHIGVVLESTYAEIALEQGFLFYAHEFVPSLGLRWSFKDGWKE